MMSLGDSKVQQVADIDGATIGYTGTPFDRAILETLQQHEGLPDGAFKAVTVGYNQVPALLTGKVDAVIGVYWNVTATLLASESGKPPVVIQLAELGVPTFDELVIVANAERLANDPAYADAVRRFLVAVVKGTEGAVADPEGAVEIMLDETKDGSEKTPEVVKEGTEKTLGILTPPDGRTTGCFSVSDWSAFGDWMLQNGLIEQPVDVGSIVTNDFQADCTS